MPRLRTALSAVSALAALSLGLTACSGSPATESDRASDRGQTIVVATSASPRPFTFKDEAGELTGYDIEVLKLIDEARDDLRFEYQVTDFAGLFAGLDSGRYHLVANNLSTSTERREKYAFAEPHTHHVFGVAVPEDSDITEVSSFAELAGKRVNAEPGLNFTKILENYNEQHPDQQVQLEYTELDTVSQFRQVATGQLDFAFNDRVVYEAAAAAGDLPLRFIPIDDAYLEPFGTSLYSAFAFSKQTPNLDRVLQAVNAELMRLGESGTLRELAEKFVGDDISTYPGQPDDARGAGAAGE